MRLDRFITLNVVKPLRRALVAPPASRLASLPVLMYHSISDAAETGVHPYYRVCTSPGRFREQMQCLKDHGYQGVTLGAGLASLNRDATSLFARGADSENGVAGRPNSQLPTPNSQLSPVVLTFDDGFRDFYTAAGPILREFGFTATMYLPTAFIGSKSKIENRKSKMDALLPGHYAARRQFNGRDCLAWNEVRELHGAGIEFGSHTVNHPKLTEMSWPQIQSEIANSKSEIENHLGAPCPAFAYPYAFPQADREFVARFMDLLKSSGYETNVTTQIGRHHPGGDGLQIKRLPANQADDPPFLAAKLDGDYDWLGHYQSLSKTLRRGRTVPPQSSKTEKPKL
jgi:peptidoglycan/xylan/chitin deacetylase (PgdA/CDA1 family)